MKVDHYCGLSFYHPVWLQKFANIKMFMAVYGLLGTVQAMSFMYFLVTLTTVEKRFQIPSQTTGIILSGNEISQILLSLILSYTGGQRNRPRWIAWGMVFCAISCFILALPHFIYGPGEQSIQLTQEYLNSVGHNNNISLYLNGSIDENETQPKNICNGNNIINDTECKEIVSIVPLILIFLSQFVLGIGNTLYYSLGQTYLDDNTKKKNTPLMLAFAMALRMIGPVFGFILGAVCLSLFIDFTRTPLIERNDPKWLGAWWFGWIILGSIMLLFSGLIGLFPKKLQNKEKETITHDSNIPKVLQHNNILDEVCQSSNALDNNRYSSTLEIPKLSNFRTALLRLLKNNLLMFNIISGIFYVLGASGYMTFLTKYMEVQFKKSAQNATILVGPLTIMGMVFGLLVSGFIISKKQPNPSKVLFWNVIVGFIYTIGQISYLFLYCSEPENLLQIQTLNLTEPCNVNCDCTNVTYNPVCDLSTQKTYFSPCHAGCQIWDNKNKNYMNCSCLNYNNIELNSSTIVTANMDGDENDYNKMITVSQFPDENIINNIEYKPTTLTTSNIDNESDYDITTEQQFLNENIKMSKIIQLNNLIEPPSLEQSKLIKNYVIPGICLKSCASTFYIFASISLIVHLFGASGRIGNILVNYRSVSTQDKSIAQGLTLMLVSLFALIPGPIIFGRLIDSTCLIWTNKCGVQGNCEFYDQTLFRYKINAMAIALTILGIFFDILVWYYGKKLDFYGEREQEQLKKNRNNHLPLLEQTN